VPDAIRSRQHRAPHLAAALVLLASTSIAQVFHPALVVGLPTLAPATLPLQAERSQCASTGVAK
jgi:hypothetical protein